MAGEEGPKIIVDEDWKTQIERERESALKAKEEPAAAEPAAAADEKPTPFESLISYLATVSLSSMGAFAREDDEEVMVNLNLARFMIEALVELRKKTKGNLDVREEGMLMSCIADLQQAFVQCSEAVQTAMMQQGGPRGPQILRP
ncbi:MAG: hypothetical protein QG656_2210 [Candidatus Hydrogenedentes bacterium]|nr:hypothetical protein [Candidatus Hydrogenedentota bacterium]